MSIDIVIIGGGPIGCWTALQLKKRKPDLNITIYERFQTYQRDHIMTIQKRSFTSWSAAELQRQDFLSKLAALQATCSELCRPKHTALWSRQNTIPKTLDIRTIDFEHFIHEQCRAAGINFVYQRIDSPQEVMDAHPACQKFIAADGANSKMRTAVFGEDCLHRYDILPSVDIKYKAQGQTSYLLKSTFDRLAHIGLENVNLQGPDGRTDVNLRFVVSQADYDVIPDATFKQPLPVTPNSPFWDKMSKKHLYHGRTFKDDFYDYLGMRKAYTGEVIADAPMTLTKIYLSRYSAKQFAKTVQHNGTERSWFLVGDAAMGMPFYRSINSGLILGSQLGYVLSRDVGMPQKIFAYNFYTRPIRIMREFSRTKYLECKAHALLKFIRPILFHAAHIPGLRRPVVRPFDMVAKWRSARFP